MNVPVWLCIPFAGLLACVALGPVLFSEWWEKNEPKAVIAWACAALVLCVPVLGAKQTAELAAETLLNDYVSFIVLLFGLYCVAGNITFEGDLAGSPRVNIVLLTMGTLLSSVIGTTGSSMLMIRPVIKMNSWRRHKGHIMIFFIFLVSNLGGCLTPLGDPPLLMGFMRGVPFFWSLHLFAPMLLNMIVLSAVFYPIDLHYYRRDVMRGRRPDISAPGTELKVGGAHNLIFIAMIVSAVIASGVLPNLSAFQDETGAAAGIRVMENVKLTYPALIEIAVILAAAWLSFATTNPENRRKNHFTWASIREVAVLFIGIFITMQPALMLLREYGGKMALTKPWEMFWATGALSSFLDNTPTYLVFLTAAGALGEPAGVSTSLGLVPVRLLEAVSAGAVFMGANTYIGNAPNFMVKSISEENGVSMPSFFGYMKWSLGCLVPVFLLDMLVFFR